MKNNNHASTREDAERAAIVTRINALLAKTPPAPSISTTSRAAAFKDAAKRASSVVAKQKPSLRSLKEAERDLAMYHAITIR